MKKSFSYLPWAFGFWFVVIGLQAGSQTRYNFNGLWKTSEDVLVHIKDTANTIVAKYLNPGDCPTGHDCVLSGGGEYYVKGTVTTNNKMDLKMLRCTHKKAMRDEGLSDRWVAPCKVNSVTATSISGSFRMEWYNHEVRDGKEVNFTRNASRDYDSPFTLTRTTCREELEKLAAEIDQKTESLKEQATAIDDVAKSFHDAIQTYREEVDEQVREEVFQGVVPPPIKVVTTAYDNDPAGHIESWADLVKDLAESGGKIAIKTGTWIISIADMLMDLGNIIAKGVVTLNETGQISSELQNMRDRRTQSFHSWANSWLEYNKMSELCAGEIPKEQQPKPKGTIIGDDRNEAINSAAEEAKTIHAGIVTDIESGQAAIQTSVASIKNLERFLDPYKNADLNKTVKEIMTTSGVSKLQSALIEIGNNWINVLRLIERIDAKMKRLKEIPAPSVG